MACGVEEKRGRAGFGKKAEYSTQASTKMEIEDLLRFYMSNYIKFVPRS